MRLDFARQCFATFGVVLAGIAAGLVGCSSESKIAGNSAETGSPELASIEGGLYLANGKAASLARVRCVPSTFDILHGSIADSLQTEAGEDGSFALKLAAGSYSLEASHPETGELLLVQNIEVPDSGDILVSDTLQSAGFALLKVDLSEEDEGTEGVAYALGTTIYRSVKVEGGFVLVDSLPAGNLDLVISLDDGHGFTANYDGLKITPKDTVKVGVDVVPADTIPADTVPADTVAVKDTLVMRFVAPMAMPEGAIDSLVGFVSDIPLALRLTPENCDFDTLAGMDGRWEVQRVKADGSRSKKLPIASGFFDSLAREAVFWVNVDSLNLDDSLELRFDNTLKSGFALDVFPTNRSYTAVWHFEDVLDSVPDAAEKRNFPGTATGVKATDGVVGSGVVLTAGSYVVAKNSALADSSLHSDLVYDVLEPFDFSLWVRLDAIDKEQVIFEKADKEYGLRFDPESGFVVDFYHVATVVASDSGASDTVSYSVSWSSGLEGVVSGEWVYVAFSKHGFSKAGNGRGVLFVDDRKVETFVKTPWDGNRSSAADFRIGGFTGSLDEFMIGGGYNDVSWTYLTYLNQKPTGYWPRLSPKK